MANDFFQFKQFRVVQKGAAMKVCTDSCLLGAWATPPPNTKSILDIGTGTGLLSLMLAQRIQASITAIEIDPDAYQQAKQNIAQSPWQSNIQLHHISLQDFVLQNPLSVFDFIICNPPFFENHLPSANPQRNTALHSYQLDTASLIDSVDALLSANGEFLVMHPRHEANRFAQAAQAKAWQLHHHLSLFNRQGDTKIFRVIQKFSKVKAQPLQVTQLFIRTTENHYHPDFEELLRPYYLIF